MALPQINLIPTARKPSRNLHPLLIIIKMELLPTLDMVILNSPMLNMDRMFHNRTDRHSMVPLSLSRMEINNTDHR
jgi:hypothetical protein